MMSTTHAAAGLLLVAPLVRTVPEFATVGALAAILGGVFPDLDLAVGVHRKSLHFPVYYWLAALPAAALALLAPSAPAVAAACFFGSAALHSGTDWLGAGDELRPWEGTSEKAVYLHPRRRWLRPKRWIRYDGAPEDLLALVVLAAPAILIYDGAIRTLLVAGLVVSAGYTVFRRRLPAPIQRFMR